jgi:hypothetical protein
MKHLLITTIAAVVLVGCGESQQSLPIVETKPVDSVVEAEKAKPPTAKAPDILIIDAIKAGNIEAVKQYLTAGTDVNAKDSVGWTALHQAAYGGHKEIVELLITKGADVNAKNDSGSTPLRAAALNGHKEVVELLIEKGADVNAKNVVGMTPLHYAAQQGHKETAELLIGNGADVSVLANDGTTPLDWARAVMSLLSPEIKAAKIETAALLRKHGGKTGEELKAAGK